MQTRQIARYSKKAQLKIQQMAFVLVMLMIFFGIIALIYFTILSAGLKKSAIQRQEEEAFQTVLAITGTPEFAFTSSSDCSSCIDFEKIISLDKNTYKNLWNFDYLEIEIVYPVPSNTQECTSATYPNCGKVTIIPEPENVGSTSRAFVSIVSRQGDTFKYEFGKIKVSAKNPNG